MLQLLSVEMGKLCHEIIFVFQCMEATQSGLNGVLAVCLVALELRRGSGSVTIHFRPMEGATVQDQHQIHAVVTENLVQVRAAGIEE